MVKKALFTLIFIGAVVLTVDTYSQARSIRGAESALSAYNFGSLGQLTIQEQIAILKKIGYKGIVLNTETKADSINLDYLLTALKADREFVIHAVMVRYNFSDQFSKRENWKRIVDKIAHRNSELWLIFGKKTEEIFDGFIETKLKEIAEYAKTKKVKVILYPHSKCAIASAEEALPYVQKLNYANLKVAIHLCHEIRAGNGSRMNEVFEAVGAHLGAVTVCGSDSVADFSKPLLMDKSTIKPICEGNFDITKFLTPLRKSGYRGLVGFINFKIDEDPEIYLKRSMKEWNNLQR